MKHPVSGFQSRTLIHGRLKAPLDFENMNGKLPGFWPGFSTCLRVIPNVIEADLPEYRNVRSARLAAHSPLEGIDLPFQQIQPDISPKTLHKKLHCEEKIFFLTHFCFSPIFIPLPTRYIQPPEKTEKQLPCHYLNS